MAAAEAIAAFQADVTPPLVAVANRAVDTAPRPVKEWAVETFGTADKPVLVAGVVATVAGLAFLAGMVGVTRPRLAVGAFLVLSAVAATAVVTDRAASAATAARLVPVVALVVTGLASLLVLLRALRTDRSREKPVASAPREAQAPLPAVGREHPRPRPETIDPETLGEHTKPRLLLPHHVAETTSWRRSTVARS